MTAATKTIRTPEDLAINGAPPAFSEPLHVGRPNIGNATRFHELISEVIERRWLTNNGPLVQQLEQRIAEWLGVKHCVATCNGTVALEIAIRALNLSGEVIIPSYTFIATAHALHWSGITPVFADIDPCTHLLDPSAVRRAITGRTTGIIPVHLWGRAAPIEELQEIAEDHGLKILYDAAHAFGCSHRGQTIGSFGDAEVFSFHATKFFNTIEGGAITTNNDELAQKMRLMRNFGFAGYDNVISNGTNGKMTEVCAAMGLVNMDAINYIVEANRRVYHRYRSAFSELPGFSVLEHEPHERHNHQYVVLDVQATSDVQRDHIVSALHCENILARKYFWPGCHRMAPYRELFPDAGMVLPNTQAVADRVIVLPTGQLLPEHAPEVIAAICRVLSGR